MRRRWAALGGLAATVLATALMFWLRGVFQIRTLPERLTEWALLFVPPEQFERAITTFGTQAKVYALYGAVAAMAAVLVGTGAVAARSATGPWAAGGGLWLLAMAVVMPLTGGGAFGRELPQDALLVNAAFAAVALAYVLTLLAARALAVPAAAAPSAARRSLLVGAGATAASFAALWLLRGRIGGRTDLPLATFDEPTPGPVAAAAAAPTAAAPAGRPHPSPLPEGAGTRGQTTTPGTTPVATGPPTAVASPTAPAKPTVEAIPQPPPVRELKREHDGASTAVPRKSGELSTFVTPNELFYITTKNPVSDPVVDGAGWRLAIDGEVGRPVQLDYRTLRRLPAVELHRTLECISNFVDKPELAPFGNGLISNAVWRGARLGDVLGLAGGVKPTGKWLTLVTADEFNAVVPAELAADPECVLAYEMNGQVLPREHGYPARLLVPGRYGLKSAKWVIAIRAHEKEMLDWYGQRGWSKDGFVKTMSRIDTPASGTAPPAGRQRIAGVAYAADRGVTKVEYSADGGRSWREAEIVERAPSGKDSWVIWQGAFEMPSGGKVSLRARATDGRGELQIETFSLPQPDGASGWHTVELPSR